MEKIVNTFQGKFASLLAVSLFVILAVASGESQKEIEKKIENETPVLEVSTLQLSSDYKNNGVAADEKYKDKTITVTGVVCGIDRDVFKEIYVKLDEDGDAFGTVQCYFSEDHAKQASKLVKGQKISIKGKCEGQIISVMLKGCQIVN
jgi:hypothetical protein